MNNPKKNYPNEITLFKNDRLVACAEFTLEYIQSFYRDTACVLFSSTVCDILMVHRQ